MTSLEIISGFVGTVGISALYVGSTKIWPPYQPVPISEQYLTFEILSSGTIGLISVGTPPSVTVQYSLNNGSWTSLNNNETINVSAGDSVRWKGTNTKYATDNNNYNHFSGTTIFNIKGNLVSLIYGDNFVGQESQTLAGHSFNSIFKQSKCADAYDLYINVKTGTRSLRQAFALCSLLVRPPKEIKGQDTASLGLGAMFSDCYSLQFLPDMSNFVLNTATLQDAFTRCTSIKETPALYSGATPQSAYQYAFNGCSSLERAILPSETLANRAYWYAFNGCNSLHYIELGATTGNTGSTTNSSFYNWVNGVASAGTIVKKCEFTLPSGNNGIPNGWTVEDDCPPVTKYRLTARTATTMSDGDTFVIINPTSKTILTGIGTGETSFSDFSGSGLYDSLPAGATVFKYYSGYLKYSNDTCANSTAITQSQYSSQAKFINSCASGTMTTKLASDGKITTSVPQYAAHTLYLVAPTSSIGYPYFEENVYSSYFYGYKLTEETV